MRARIIHMDKSTRQTLKVYLWQIFEVKNITIERTGRKYPRETKWVNCVMKNSKPVRFLWYEVEILN